MTENLLQKLEEKMMLLLTEVEDSRREIQRLTHKNLLLEAQQDKYAEKISDLISILDTIPTDTATTVPALKPVLVQQA